MIGMIAAAAALVTSPVEDSVRHLHQTYLAGDVEGARREAVAILRQDGVPILVRRNALSVLETLVPERLSADYTRIGEANCHAVASLGSGERVGVCGDFSAYQVRVVEAGGDRMVEIERGRLRYRFTPLADPFRRRKNVGPALEWRMKRSLETGDVPVAAIVRVFHGEFAQFLTVHALQANRACLLASVDAARFPDANDIASVLADLFAETFTCGKDEPFKL